ncbi:uncharacterized protein LOC129948422 [Eupeodes corollae]|uniref:uncharacterized protein LOC129948422 n=1 Tax=Eupeodes corollae TaxID=290404 RepID=UPI0024926219|nr:uncharacterized protein LOC129948422 [Eupeodes corollae]
MDGFNSKQFYGHSWSDDPKLRTTTRNYEFKYNCSDHLERVINRVRMDREKKKELKLLSQFANSNKSRVIQMPTTTIETQIGSSKPQETVVKIMSDKDIEEMISQSNDDNLPKFSGSVRSPKHFIPPKEFKKTQKPDEKLPQIYKEVFPHLHPQWVEIKPIQKSVASLFEIPIQVKLCNADESSDSEEYSDHKDHVRTTSLERNTTKLEKNKSIRKNHYLHSLSFESGMSNDFVIRNEKSDIKLDENEESAVDEESPPESQISLDIESSLNESEHLEMERVFDQMIPFHLPKKHYQDLESEEVSEFSEYSNQEDEEENKTIQDSINLGKEASDDDNSTKSLITKRESKEQVQKIDPESRKASSFRSTKSSAPTTPKPFVKRSSKQPNKDKKPLSANRTTTMVSEGVRSNVSIDDLKKEKLRIFSKMTSIQDNIIKNLDSLRISLVEISLPDGDVEQKLRERNALEFSVRFSRNYLFPLGKMIDNLRLSPKEEFCSALTNEPCIKVCGIYGLLCQAIQCYQKQLRHFYTDCFPKKLDTLLNLIKDTTNICLEKRIFDKRDILIQDLISRCVMFLGFVFEMAERKKIYHSEMALQSDRKSRYKLPKTSSKWDLTMNLNNLNMYEPKLVPKKPTKTPQNKTAKIPNSQRPSVKNKKIKKLIPKYIVDPVVPMPCEDLLETQVRKDNQVDSVQLINDVIAEEPDSDLAKAVIETLQDITKDEVHQMFGPIVSNLNSIINSSVSFEKCFDLIER